MPHRYIFRLSLNGRFRGGTLAWNPALESNLFFASLLEKIEKIKGGAQAERKDKKLDILLADDDQDDRELFEEAITMISANIQVTTVSNGMELMRYLQEGNRPHMIFLDLNMPGKNGKECLSEIRKNRIWKSIPVVIYSTSLHKKDILETYTNGASLYLLKPTSFIDLIRILKRAFSIDLESDRVPQNDFVLSNSG